MTAEHRRAADRAGGRLPLGVTLLGWGILVAHAGCGGASGAGGSAKAAPDGADSGSPEARCTADGQVPTWAILGSGATVDGRGLAFWAVAEIPVRNRSSGDAHNASGAKANVRSQKMIMAQLDEYIAMVTGEYRRAFGEAALAESRQSEPDEETAEVLARMSVAGLERMEYVDRWRQPDSSFALGRLTLDNLLDVVDPGAHGGHPLQRFLRQHGERIFRMLADRHLEARLRGPYGPCLAKRLAPVRTFEGWAQNDRGPWCGPNAAPPDFERVTPLVYEFFEVRRGSSPDGELVAGIRTDESGQFQVELPRGTFCVKSPGSTACLLIWEASPEVDAMVIETGYRGPGCGDALIP